VLGAATQRPLGQERIARQQRGCGDIVAKQLDIAGGAAVVEVADAS
jgi:hypothetical protein